MNAPIIIFVYNRVDKIKRLIASLSVNKEARDSDLYIFSDAPKTEKENQRVNDVREYIESLQEGNLFKKVVIDKASSNRGLAASIIRGVSIVQNQYGKAIIVEDDNVVSPDFLDYMNRGLDYYENDTTIMAINGYSRTMALPEKYNHDVFLLQRTSSYTWATWKNRWNHINWDISGLYPEFFFNKKVRSEFNRYGKDRALLLDAQVCGDISSWAIRFDYHMFEMGLFCVTPCVSRSECNGNDGSGTHSSSESHLFDTKCSDGSSPVIFGHIQENEEIRHEFVKAYELTPLRKIIGNADFMVKYYKNLLFKKK